MKIGELQDNVDTFVADMYAQTGKIPGVSTKLCHALLVAALRRGARIDPTSHHELSPDEQVKVEQQHDIFRASLSVLSGPLPPGCMEDFLDDLLRSELPYDAIMLAGHAAVGDARGGHGIAVIKVEDGEADLAIVDSLADGGLVECGLDSAAAHVRERFDGSIEEWYLLFSRAVGQPLVGAQHRLDVDPSGFISAHVEPVLVRP